MKTKLKSKIIFLFVVLLVTIFTAILLGAVDIPLTDIMLKENRPILILRLSRILLGALASSGLAVSGIALQAILRNPLAEPYLLGTSSGAGLGAIIAIIGGVSTLLLPLAAFIGALLSVVVVYNLAKQGNKVPVQSLILSGVIVSITLSSIIMFLISFSGSEVLHGAIWWLWGSLQVFNFKLLFIVGVIVILGVILITILAQDLNAISIGEEEAIHLGIKIETVKKWLFFLTSLISAALVCICGIIGFVGLIVPHAMRLFVGPNHKILIPSTCLAAAIFMILADIISRSVFAPIEIPIGVVTALIGSPIFIILLKSRQRV